MNESNQPRSDPSTEDAVCFQVTAPVSINISFTPGHPIPYPPPLVALFITSSIYPVHPSTKPASQSFGDCTGQEPIEDLPVTERW